MNPVLILARLAIKEAVRRKIAVASVILGVAFLLVFNIGFHFLVSDIGTSRLSQERQAVILKQAYNFLHLAAMYATNFMTIVFATLITSDTLSGEIATGTIQVTVAKPIRRWQVVLGKWLGNAVLLALYFLLLAGGSVLGIWAQTGYTAPGLAPGMALVFLNGLLVMTVALAFSASMSTLATGGAVFGLFGVAFIGGWVERIGNFLNNQTAVNVGIVSSLLMPSEAVWNLASKLMTDTLASAIGATPFSYGVSPSPLMIDFTFLYLAGFLAYAFYKFNRRDL